MSAAESTSIGTGAEMTVRLLATRSENRDALEIRRDALDAEILRRHRVGGYRHGVDAHGVADESRANLVATGGSASRYAPSDRANAPFA